MSVNNSSAVIKRFHHYTGQYPHLKKKLYRQLLIHLHTKEIVTIDHVYREANRQAQLAAGDKNHTISADSQLNKNEMDLIQKITLDYAGSHLSTHDIDQIVSLTQRRTEAKALEEILSMPNVSFKSLAEKVKQFCEHPEFDYSLPPAEELGIRAALVRHFISEQLDFIGIAKNHFHIRDMLPIIHNSFGPKTGIGKIGGKSAGMFLGYNILVNALKQNPDNQFSWRLKIPESYFLRSDLYQEFIHSNGLNAYYDEKYNPVSVIRQDFPVIKEEFKNGEFPERITKRLTRMLKMIGRHPLIVRSSSLLEDNFGFVFSGKYDSIFLANQGDLKDRLDALLNAIAHVYASTLGPDPILYRRQRNLIDYDERMAILIQKVVGIKYDGYYLPEFSGVAFSRNEYRWDKRIRKEDGLVRLVMGLGTHAVDRVGADYPRMVALTAPTLRPEGSATFIQKYSQRSVDVIDLKNDGFSRLTLAEILGSEPFPGLDNIVSIKHQDSLRPPIGKLVSESPENLVITFDKLLKETQFAKNMSWIIKTLENAYESPIDLEFAVTGNDFYLLQCRPLPQVAPINPVELPENIPPDSLIFTVEKDAQTGVVRNIEYIIYIDPLDYDNVKKPENKSLLGSLIGQLNDQLFNRSFILMGPGRWGSNDINLGIPVRYSDIHNTKLLIEIARAKGDYIPEVSFGTHFFLDLVESGIYYLPLYPDDPKVVFNEEFLRNSENMLADFLPNYREFAQYLRVIHVPSAANGKYLHIHMDGEEDRALSFLSPKV